MPAPRWWVWFSDDGVRWMNHEHGSRELAESCAASLREVYADVQVTEGSWD